jgi:hypothetical protein
MYVCMYACMCGLENAFGIYGCLAELLCEVVLFCVCVCMTLKMAQAYGCFTEYRVFVQYGALYVHVIVHEYEYEYVCVSPYTLMYHASTHVYIYPHMHAP